MNEKEIVREKIEFVLDSLPKGEKEAGNYLLGELERLEEVSLPEIAEATGISQTTIVRFFKRLGYTGFREFKRDFLEKETAEREGQTSEIKDIMNEVIEENIKIMKKTFALITDAYEEAAEAIMKARAVTLVGNGDAFVPCSLFAMKLMRVGIPSQAVNEPSIQMLSASSVRPGDIFLGVSYSGRTKSVVESMRKAWERGAVTIGITGAAKAPLLKYCTITIHTVALNDMTGGDLISRRISEQTVVETLYQTILNRLNEQIKSNRINIAEDINSMYMIQEDDLEL